MSEIETIPEPAEEGPSIAEARNGAMEIMADVLEYLYGSRVEDGVETPAGHAAWAAWDLILALTASVNESEEEISTEESNPA